MYVTGSVYIKFLWPYCSMCSVDAIGQNAIDLRIIGHFQGRKGKIKLENCDWIDVIGSAFASGKKGVDLNPLV